MALTAVRNTLRQDNAPHPGNMSLPVEATTTIWQGAMVCVNAAGNAVPAAATAGFSTVLGRAENTANNATGAAGDINVEVVPGVYRYDNSGTSIADANRYEQCFAVDDEAVHLSNAGGRPLAGTIVDVDAFGVWVSISGLMTSAGASTSTAASGNILNVRGASTANIANLASFTVANDGITLVETERVLVKDQAAGAENGVYVCGAVAGGLCALTRAADADDGTELSAGTIVAVSEGTAGLDTAWKLDTNNDIVVGTTAQVWTQVSWGYGAAGAMVNQTIAAADAGTALVAARVDHNHNFPTANAALIQCDTTAAGAGAAATFAASDHVHQIAAPGAAAQVDCNTTAAAAGAAVTFSRSDHVHGIVAPGNGAQIDCALTAAGPGVANTFSRSDHVHAIQAPVAPANTGTLAAAGASTVFATANHVHVEHAHEVRYVMTTDVANLAAFPLLQDGVTGNVGELVLLANQTVGAESGVYEITATAPPNGTLERADWMPATAIINGGYTVHVDEGTLFADTTWFIDTNGAVTIATTAHSWFPECVTQTVVLVAGTATIATVPVLSATRTGFVLTRRIANTTANTIMYCTSVGGANGVTAGDVGVASVIIEACIANGTINAADISTLNFTILNR